MVIPGEPATVYFPGFASGINTTDGAPSVEILDAIDKLIGTFRDAVGPKVGLCLDLNYNFRTEGVLRIAKAVEPFDLQWLEYDNWDPRALLQIKESTTTRICSGESLITTRQYRPFFELHAMDVAMVDVRVSRSFQIGAGRKVTPQLEIFNLGNASTVVRNTPGAGANYLAPAEILAPRVVKLGFSLTF